MAKPTHTSLPLSLDSSDLYAGDKDFGSPYGLFGRRKIKAMVRRKLIVATKQIEESQYQPASLDLRLSKEATAFEQVSCRTTANSKRASSCAQPRADLSCGRGAVLEKGIVYIARITENVALLPSISGAANPKSSTGRLDIFTRLIVNRAEAFDEVPLGYCGELWLEISPRSFSVRVREGSKLSQIRFRNRNSQQMGRLSFALSDDELKSAICRAIW